MSAGSANLLELIVRGVSQGVAEALNSAAKGAEDMAKRVAAASKKADDAIQKAGESMGKVGEGLASGFQSTAKTVVTAFEAVALAAGTAIVGAFAAAGNEARKFDAALGELRGLNVSNEDLERYHDSLLAIRATTSVGLIDLTKGLYDTIRAGVRDAATATELLNVAQMNSVTAGGSVGANAKVLAVALNTFGKEATTAAEKAEFLRTTGDKLNAIISAGKFEVDDFAAFLGKVAPVASDAGLSIDEVGAALTTMAESGLAPKAAIAALESLLEKMLVPSSAATKAADALGVKLGESALKANGFRGTLEALTTSTGGSRVALDALLGDTGAVNAAMLLAGDTTAKFDAKLKTIGESAGGLASDFAKAEEEIDHRISRVWGNVLDDLIPAFERMKPAIADALESVARFVSENGAAMADALSSVLGVVQGLFGFLIDHKEVILSILGAIFATKIFDTFLGGVVSVTKGLGGVGDAFKTMGAIASGTLTDTAGKLVTGAGKVTAFAGAVGTIGGAFLALAPVVIAVVDAIITQIGKAQRELEKFVLATNKAVADASKAAITDTTRRFGAIAKEINDLAATDIAAARDRAEALIAVESETLARRRANIDAFNARLRAEREKLADEEERERVSGLDKGAEETKARIIEIEAGLAAERHAMEEEVKIRGFLAEFTSDKIEGERKATDDLSAHKKARSKEEAEAAIAGIKKVADAREKDRVDYAAYQTALTRAAEEEAKKRAAFLEAGQLTRAIKNAEIPPIEFELQLDKPTQDLKEAISGAAQDGSVQGLDQGLQEAAKNGDWAQTLAGRLTTTFASVATKFGGFLMDAAQGVGDFFLDLFVTGPLSEFMNLLSLASNTSPTGTVNDQGETQADAFADVLAEQFQGWIDKITNFVQNLPTLLRGLVPFVGELVNAFVDAVPQIIGSFVANIGPLVQSIIDSVGTLADTFRNNVERFIGDIEAAIEAWLPRLVDALIDLVLSSLNSDVFQRVQQMIADLVGQLIGAIIELLPDLIGFILETAPDLIIALVDVIVGDLIPKLVQKIPDIIGAFIEGLPDMIGELVEGLVGGILSAIPEIVVSLIEAVVSMLGQGGGLQMAGEIVYAVIVALINAAVEFGNAIAEAFKNAFAGDTFKASAEEVGKLIGRAILGALTGGVSEVVRGAVNRGNRGRRERQAAERYDAAVVAWQNAGAGQDAAWLAANPPPEASDYQAHTGGLVLPSGQVQHFRFGGIVQAMQAAFAGAGSGGEVPITAMPGEMVLTPDQQAQLFAAAQGGSGRGGNVYNLMPGSAVIVDGQKNIDAVLSTAVERGTGKAGRAMRAKSGPPIRPIPRFGVG